MITLFQHGYAGSAKTFEKLVKVLSKESNFIFYSEIISANNFNKENFQIFYKENYSKSILVITEFINCFDINQNQIVELEYIIENLKKITSEKSFNLVGHSKGGLINLEYYLSNKENVNKIVSISTPYAANKFADIFKELVAIAERKGLYHGDNVYIEGLEMLGREDFLSSLRKKWNDEGEANKLFIIAGVSSKIKKILFHFDKIGRPKYQEINRIYSDGLVSLEDQLGKELKNNNLIVSENNIKIFDDQEPEIIIYEKANQNNFNLKLPDNKINTFLEFLGVLSNFNLNDFFHDIRSFSDSTKLYHHVNILEQPEVIYYIKNIIK